VADQRIRELQRRYEESGLLEDARRHLEARVRAGQVTWRHLSLAGYLGQPLVRELLGMRNRLDYPGGKRFRRWGQRLYGWGPDAWVRVANAAARASVVHHPDLTEQLEPALAAAEGWMACACEEHRGRASEARASLPATGPTSVAVREALRLIEARGALHSSLLRTLAAAAEAVPGPQRFTRLHRAIAAQVIPWCMDPFGG
jgi:hypothetical protein